MNKLKGFLKKHIKALLLLITVIIILVFVFISYEYRHYNLSKNILLVNLMFLLELVSYILGSVGAFSIIVAVLQYRQSETEGKRRNIDKSMDLIRYFLSKIANKDFRSVKFIASKIERENMNEIRGYLDRKHYSKHFEIGKGLKKKLILNS